MKKDEFIRRKAEVAARRLAKIKLVAKILAKPKKP
jgi:hypothetical protein